MPRDASDPVATSQLIEVILAVRDTSNGRFDIRRACFLTSMHKKIFSLELPLETHPEIATKMSSSNDHRMQDHHGKITRPSSMRYL
jgi:hypothetical protein